MVSCDSLLWNGLKYISSGTYTYITPNSVGCDSTATLNLTINNSESNSFAMTECDHYIWNGDTLTSSGLYVDTLQTTNSCDSVVSINLTINNSYNDTVNVFACENYTWNGVTYISAGNYTDTLTSITGCDSVVTLSLDINVTIAGYAESFDSGFPGCWSQEVTDSLEWTLDDLGTPSGGTGPSDDFTGGGNYMYVEASLPAGHGDIATMYSDNIDISSLINPELRFFSHMYGSATGSLTVDMWNGSIYTNVFTKSGDQGDQWNEEKVLLSTLSSIVHFRISAVLDTNANGDAWAGDIAIDEFGVKEAIANDLALVAAAISSGCDLTATEPIEVWVVNQGLVAETGFDLSYSVNGSTPVVENITTSVNPGDTLMYVFTATADMSMDNMVYNVDLACLSADDPSSDSTNNFISGSGENLFNPLNATTMGDTICSGDTAYVEAEGDGYIYWYDAATGGNLVDEGDIAMVTPTATTSYYAEVAATNGFEDDFESYNAGDSIALMSNVWEAWSGPDGGGADDAVVSNAQASSGSNSLYLNNAAGDDIILPFGDAYSSGKFYYSMNMYIVTDAYFNFQADVTVGAAWAFDVILANGVIYVEIAGDTVLQGAYSGTNPTGAPVWFSVEFDADLTTGVWELSTNGNSQGTFTMTSTVAAVNLYANTGNEYYIDDVEWGALTDDACRSGRTEAIVTVEDCSNINVLSFRDLSIYPNPNNGQFTITNSQDMTEVIITDLQGKVVYNNTNVNSSRLNINMDYLERGMYMVNIKTEKDITTKTIVVQ